MSEQKKFYYTDDNDNPTTPEKAHRITLLKYDKNKATNSQQKKTGLGLPRFFNNIIKRTTQKTALTPYFEKPEFVFSDLPTLCCPFF